MTASPQLVSIRSFTCPLEAHLACSAIHAAIGIPLFSMRRRMRCPACARHIP
jgi:hypothetical protein